MPNSSQRNLEILVKLRAPAVASGLIHLDALLAAACTAEGLQDQYWTQRSQVTGEALRAHTAARRLPLSRKTTNGFTIHRASAAHFVGADGLAVARWFKRWDDAHDDMVDFGRNKAQVRVSFGAYISYAMPMPYHTSLEMVFWAQGSATPIGELLHALGYIGKKTSQGYGEIADVQIKRVAEDWSMFRGASGVPTRAIPVEMGHGVAQGVPQQLTGWRPPYWEPDNQTLCWVPPQATIGGTR